MPWLLCLLQYIIYFFSGSSSLIAMLIIIHVTGCSSTPTSAVLLIYMERDTGRKSLVDMSSQQIYTQMLKGLTHNIWKGHIKILASYIGIHCVNKLHSSKDCSEKTKQKNISDIPIFYAHIVLYLRL